MAEDYEGLKAEIADYLGRTDLERHIPRFIRMAESAMNRELRLKLMERQAYTTLAPGQSSVVLPDKRVPGDWDVFLQMRDLRLNGERLDNLDYMTLKRIPEERLTGKPRWYSIRGRELVLIPTPDKECGLLMVYYAEVPPLSELQPANDILLRSPDLYLFGALVASAPYARSSAPLELWLSFYQRAAASLAESDNSGRFTSNLAMSPIRSI